MITAGTGGNTRPRAVPMPSGARTLFLPAVGRAVPRVDPRVDTSCFTLADSSA